MTIEERLNEIVEKGQGDAIIPFLQGLTQEERKTLVPCLNKLEEHYNKFVQLNENTYGTRGTPEYHQSYRPRHLFAKRIPQTRMGNLYGTAERIDSVVYSFLARQFLQRG